MTWATADDVHSATGVTVEAAHVTQAQSTIEVACGRMADEESRIRARDLGWLRLAVAYQAAWLSAQPDMWERMNLTATGGSGSSAMTGTSDWLTVAPMARRALDRVSWMRSRSLHVKSSFLDGLPPVSAVPTAETNDEWELWRPMGGR